MTPCKECAYCSPTPGGSLYCALTDHFVPNLGCKHGEPINKPKTNADRIRAMSDEDLALFLETTTEHGRVSETEWMTWLKGKAQI